MTFSQIEYFLEVARTMNFHRAAENKFISQQVISRQVQALEQELDLELFDRSNKRNLTLTPAGELLYNSWKESVEDMKYALEQARNLGQKDRIVLGIHAISWIVDSAVDLLQQIRNKNKDLTIETIVAGTALLEEELRQGNIHLILTFSSEISAKDINYCKIGSTKIHPAIMMAKSHPLASRKTLDLSDLESETIYLLKNSFSKDASRRVLRDFEEHNLSPQRIEYFDNAESMETKLMMGEGICIGLDTMFRNRDRLKLFPLDPSGLKKYDVVLFWKNPKYQKLARQFAKLTPDTMK